MQQPLYQIKNLQYEIQGKSSISITNFEIHRGIIYAIIGQAGAGKSHLLEILAGVRKPSSGQIMYDGDPIAKQAVKRKMREEVCYLAQLPGYGSDMKKTVKRYMLKRIQTASWSMDTAQDRLAEISKRMNLSDSLSRKVGTLSPGERRWVDIAACMASDAKVLILDEFEQHMSYDAMETIKRLIQRKSGHEGTTVLISTMNPVTMKRLTGVSVTLDHGRIAMIRSVREGTRVRKGQGSSGSTGRRRRAE
jgi:ABC-type multidrug transport system ATPase subunit